MLHDALELCDGPVMIRYPKGQARQVGDLEVGLGLRAKQLRAGDGRVCVLALGKMVGNAERAVATLADEGVDATLWDIRVAKPLDPAMIADAARHGAVVTAEDGIREGGVGALVLDAIDRVNRELGTTTAVITHNAVIASLADRVISLSDGRIASMRHNDRKVAAGELVW